MCEDQNSSCSDSDQISGACQLRPLTSKIQNDYLRHIDQDIDGSIDGEHQVVEPAEHLSPGGPGHQLPWIGEHLVRLVGVGHHLGAELSTLIGPDPSRYGTLIGAKAYDLKTHPRQVKALFWLSGTRKRNENIGLRVAHSALVE